LGRKKEKKKREEEFSDRRMAEVHTSPTGRRSPNKQPKYNIILKNNL